MTSISQLFNDKTQDVASLPPFYYMLDALRMYFHDKLPLTETQFATLAGLLTLRQLAKGEVLGRQGEPARFGAFVVRWCLHSYVTDARQKEHILQFATPENWWIADQHSLRRHEPALFASDAMEESEVLLLGAGFYAQLPALGPELQAFFYELLQNSLVAMQRRLIGVLSAPAKTRYQEFQQLYPTLVRRLPQRRIAACLGIMPESLSRVRAGRGRV